MSPPKRSKINLTRRAVAHNAAATEPLNRKEKILSEAIRIIGEHGYRGFTIQDLAQRCGLSNAGLLYYFNTKDLLLVAVLNEIKRRENERLAQFIDQTLKNGLNEPAQVLGLLRKIVQIGTEETELLRLNLMLRAEALDPQHPAHPTVRARDAAALELFSKILRPYYPDPYIIARRVAAMLDGLAMQRLRYGPAFNIVEEWSSVAEDLLPALRDGKKRRRATPR